MPDIPPKPALVLASLDTPGQLFWWLEVGDDRWQRCDTQPNTIPVRVQAYRLVPPRLDCSRDGGDWQAIRNIYALRHLHAALSVMDTPAQCGAAETAAFRQLADLPVSSIAGESLSED